MSARKSAPLLFLTTSASRPHFPKPAAAKSCAAYCATSPAAVRQSAIRRRSKTTRFSPNFETTKNEARVMEYDDFAGLFKRRMPDGLSLANPLKGTSTVVSCDANRVCYKRGKGA